MIPLTLQLQAEALDGSTPISDLLRKAKFVAAKLGLDEFGDWVQCELDGYTGDIEPPPYRTITSQIMYRTMHGWRPYFFDDESMDGTVSRYCLGQAITPLEDVVKRAREGAGFLAFRLPGHIQAILANACGYQTEFQIHVDASAAGGIIDAVRSKVLDWALDLEKAGVLGEGMAFNIKEREAARAMATHNTYNIQNLGVLGDVNHSRVNASQVNYSSAQLTELRSAMQQIESFVPQLDGSLGDAVGSAVSEVRSELEKASPNPSRIQSALSAMRTACEGAAGNLIASGIEGLIRGFLGGG